MFSAKGCDITDGELDDVPVRRVNIVIPIQRCILRLEPGDGVGACLPRSLLSYTPVSGDLI
jgi:hypothetical protein